MQSALSDLGDENFEFIDDLPVLKCSCGWIIFECKCTKGKVLSVSDLMPVKGKVNKRTIKPVNRGFNAVIEALVDATRYVISKEEKYLDRIKYYDTIVMKCGGLREIEAMRMMHELIGK